jgi:cytochrome b subunit of formate dehydrogenase
MCCETGRFAFISKIVFIYLALEIFHAYVFCVVMFNDVSCVGDNLGLLQSSLLLHLNSTTDSTD